MGDWLLDRLREFGSREAIISGNTTCHYDELVKMSHGWRGHLDAAGVGSGRVVALAGDFSPETCAAFLAVIDSGNIVVPLMPETYGKNPEFLDIAEVEFVLTPDVSSEIERREATPDHPLTQSLREQGDAGLVLFSSGSTGESKAALHAMAPLLEKFRVPRPALRTLVFLLLDHIGGVNTFLHVIANGGTLVTTSDRTPFGVCGIIEKTRVEVLPVSPTFLNLCLLSGVFQRRDLSSLKKITYGTEPMPQSLLDRLIGIFPKVTFQQTYGLSELGIMRSKSRPNNSLWVKVGGTGFRTRVVDNLLWIKADSAMLGYLNAPSPFDEEGWFNTHDVVETDGEYVRFLGRETEIINVGGNKVYPIEVESRLLELDNIKDAVVIGENNPLTGQMVVAQINLEGDELQRDLKRRVRTALRGKLDPFKIPHKVVIVEEEQFNQRFKHMRLDRSHRESV